MRVWDLENESPSESENNIRFIVFYNTLEWAKITGGRMDFHHGMILGWRVERIKIWIRYIL
jgi:hypothetical protein